MKLALFTIVVIFLTLNTEGYGQRRQRYESINGTVVAFTEPERSISFAPGSQTLVVRLDNKKKRPSAKYVLVIYSFFSDYPQPPLPQQMLSGEGRYRFRIVRDDTYDSSIEDISVGFIDLNTGKETSRTSRLTWVGRMEISEKTVLRAYILENAYYKELSKPNSISQ